MAVNMPNGHPDLWTSGRRWGQLARILFLGLFTLCLNPAYGDNPIFSNIDSSTVLNVDESAVLEFALATVTATDADNNNPITYSVTGTTDFGFDPNSDVLRVKGALDYESAQSHSVTIVATDAATESTSVVITVNVNDVNDNDPTLTLTDADVTLNEEEAAGTAVAFAFTGSDPDTNDGTSLTYSLSGADASIFNIDPSNGGVTLNTKVDIDPDTPNKVYNPVLEVSDGARSATASLTLTLLDINDNRPICSPDLAYETLTEETSGSTLYTLACSDEDSSYQGNDVLTYTLTSAYFSVDASGVVTVTTPVDYEVTTQETLSITVADTATGGALDTTATIVVSITATNDNNPVWGTFVPAPVGSTYTRAEDIGVGTSLFTMVATDSDQDTGGTITYSIQSVTDGTNPVTGLFNAHANTGEVTTLALLDRDSGISQYTFTLQAEDGGTGAHIISQTVFLDLTDVNDVAPVFQSTPLSLVTIAEASAKTGSVVTTVTATDGDVTAATFTFEVAAVVQGGTSVGDWAFSGTTLGQLELATDLDLDTGAAALHVLRLIVKDGGATQLTGTATLTVSISNDNEHTPTIASQPAGTVSIAENESVGTSVGTVTGADSDTGTEGDLVYSITGGNTGSAFSIDASSGLITTAVVLDRETLDNYDLEVTVSDQAASTKSVTTSVSVTVTDVNDNQPSCTSLFIAITPAENTPDGTTLTTLACTDGDSSDTLTYSVKSPHNTQFGFTSPVNELKLLTPFDYDSATQSYMVGIDVSDGTNSQSVTVSVDVDPVNEATPTFTSNPTVNVAENAVSNPIATYTADDADFSPHAVTSYAITSVTNGGASLLGIDASSGAISLTAPLDYDTLPAGDKTYELTVEATDGGGQTGTGTVTVSVTDANDNSPTCSQSTYTVDMDEKQTGAGPYDVVNPLGCSDVEDGNSLTYSLTQTPGSHFAVAADVVTLTADTLDYETASQHTLTIEVSDSGTPTEATTTVTVYVNVVNGNEGPPVFAALTAVSIDEDLGVGQSVVDVSAPDPDGTDPVFGDPQYTILSGNTDNHFSIDASEGRISVRKALDFEAGTTSYALVIQAKERGGANSASATQTINIDDVNDELPTCPSYSFTETVSENEAADYVVKSLGCTDSDAGTTLTYTITSGDTSLFKVENGDLKLNAPLDFEGTQTHSLTIQVSDGVTSHNTDITGTVSVGSVDEGPPVFGSAVYNVDVSESETAGYAVVTVAATDPDSSDDANGQITYSFVSTYSQFVLDQSSGQIALATQLDRETDATHTLLVKAEDATGSNTATVSVTVLDSNDNTPTFTLNPYTASVSESDGTGTAVVTVTAADADDTGNNYGVVTYAISGTGSTNFAIGSSSGIVTTEAVLNADGGTTSYTLTVTATDSSGGAGALTGTSVIVVTVTTVNGNDPVFSPITTSETITENQFSVGDVIATVTASDTDSGTDGDFTFAFAAAQTKFSLSQRGNEADVRLEQALDFDSGDTSFNLEIKATDGGAPARTGTGTVVITVDDVNDNSPLCPATTINLSIDENENNLGSLICTDADAGTTLTYSVLSVTPNSIAMFRFPSGLLFVSPDLDYETDTSYVILIEVSDDGAPQKSTTVTYNVQINDLNDNDPSLSAPFTFTVSETATPSNTVLYTANGDSNDGPTDVVTYSLSDTTYFDISTSTGEITLKTQAPDFETIGSPYIIEICVSDTGNPISLCDDLDIVITDENDNTPVFNPAVYQTTVAESVSVPSDLPTAVTATDADASAAFNTVTYSIVSGNTDTDFSVDPSTGVVTIENTLDAARTGSYTLVVQASDGTNSATVNYNIYVEAANEHDPFFTPNTETIFIEESLAVGDTVPVTAVATDDDSGSDGTLTYEIDAGPFGIDSTTGEITVSSPLDRETDTFYTLTVRAIDGGDTPRTGFLALTVEIDDVNDNTPTCTNSVYFASLSETASAGDPVATLDCTDNDDDPDGFNNWILYTIASGSTTLFEVDAVGEVSVKAGATFDREVTPTYTLLIDVSDQSIFTKLTSTVTVSITILDVNDNEPVFTSLTAAAVAEDTATGTTIATVVATDDDVGLNAEIVYQIISGNTGSVFSLNPASGAVVVASALDYDAMASPFEYELVITATDKGTPAERVTGTLTVPISDVLDEPITCGTSLYTATTPENAQGTSLGVSVTCTKPDAAGGMTYSITAGDPGSDFIIDSTTGALSTAAGAALDFEITPSYLLTVTATEGGQSATTSVKVTVTDVNEFAPAFTPAGPYSESVSEDAAIGTTVRTVVATDDDTGDSVKVYSITGGNAEGKFKVDASTGVVQTQAPLDREATPSYSLTLTVADSGGSTGTVVLDVTVDDVNDNAPSCTETSVARDVDEGVTSGSIYTPTCTDADTVSSPTLAYSIKSGAHASISINGATGELSLVGALDYETDTSHVVVIEVSDQDTPVPGTATVAVTIVVNPVNEFTPTFTPSSNYGPVSEDTSTGTAVVTVAATDADTGLTHGEVRFSIVSGDPSQQFAIDDSSGDISVVKPLDRETTASYTLLVRAVDDDPGAATAKSATATVSLDITDVNDLTPTFNPSIYSVDVLETAAFGPAVVLQALTVTDGDEGANAATTLTITSGNGEGKFSITGTNLLLVAALDYESTTSYDLVVTATDSGVPALSGVGRITVNVLPDNEAAPLMSSATASAEISEDTSVGTLVYDANATDIDSGSDGTVTYSIVSGVTGNDFIINSATGELFVGSQLDFDTAPADYAIIIQATDGAGASDAATSTVSLSVTLTDVNDNVPQFASSLFTFSVGEGAAAGTAVGTVVVTDDDSGVNGDVTLAVTGGSGASDFDVDPATGEVTVAAGADIDFENLEVLYLALSATDGGTPGLSSAGLVKLEVTNMNDNDPVITPIEFAVTLREDAVVGAAVYTFTATDEDTAVDGFSLVAPSTYFQVDASTGEVTTKALLDRETIASHVLQVQVIDLPTPGDPTTVRTSTATLTVILEDVNDNDPVFTGTYTPSTMEDSTINTLVFTVTATDEDDGANGQVTYDIIAGNTGNAFSIDSQGNVQVAAALDRETVASYTLTIEASDKGTPARTDQIDVTVTIGDVNDNDPVFSQANFAMNVAENSDVDTPVGTAVATDADIDDNAALTFSLDSFTAGDASHFKIDAATGAISVAQASLDRETIDTYEVTVKVTDNGADLVRTAYATVTITIDDVNDNAPVLSFSTGNYTGTVPEDALTNATIVMVVASDNDILNNAALSYSIDNTLLDGALASTLFEIDSVTGEITPQTALDYETHQDLTFIVVAEDAGMPSLSDTATVHIFIEDINDNSPVFDPTFFNTEVAYDGTCSVAIATVTATDADSGNNGLITYSLRNSDLDFLFGVGTYSGEVTLTSIASSGTIYSLDILGSDSGLPTLLTATVPAKVRVDAFVPNFHVVTLRLGISRVDFVAQQATFLTLLQTEVRNTYPTALLRLWCITEYSGVAVSPPTTRRRLLADQPVDVHTYVVEDDVTESQANLDSSKSFLTQDQLLALLAANADGDPGSALQGSDWDYYQIQQVLEYHQSTDTWWETTHGKVITAVAAFLGLALILLLLYMLAEGCCGTRFRRGLKRRSSPRATKIEPRTELDSLPPSRGSSAQGLPKPGNIRFWDNNWGPTKLNDALADDDLPTKDDLLPPYSETNELARSPTMDSERGDTPSSIPRTPRTPRSVVFTEGVFPNTDGNLFTKSDVNGPTTEGIGKSEFDGRAYDHVTGKVYEYNIKTNERRWLS